MGRMDDKQTNHYKKTKFAKKEMNQGAELEKKSRINQTYNK